MAWYTGLQWLLQKPFVRNVLTVAIGTAAAQVLGLAFTPLVTRLFGPEAFGLQGVFTSVVGLAATIIGLAYPTAIVLPRVDQDAKSLAKLTLILSALLGIGLTTILFYHGASLLRLIGAGSLVGYELLIPISAFFVVLNAVATQWLIRKHEYKLNATRELLNAFLLGTAKVMGGWVQPTALVLVAIQSLGQLSGAALSWLGWKRKSNDNKSKHTYAHAAHISCWEIGKRHWDFPLLRMPQNLINSLSQSLPVFLLASLFSPTAAGQYAIATMVLSAPAALIGNAVASVFYPRINAAILNGEDARAFIVKATWAMMGTGAVPYLAILLLGPWLFPWAFGQGWEAAGKYAQLLAPWLFLQYVNKPAVAALAPLKLQGGLLIYELFSTGSKVLALWLGFYYFHNEYYAVGFFSFAGVTAYLWLILWIIKRAQQE